MPVASFQLLLTLALTFDRSLSAPTISGGIEGQEGQEELVPIIKSVAEQRNDGSYFFAYEGADGSYREEVGIVKRSNVADHDRDHDHDANDGDETELEISGVYRYIDSQGERVEVSYVADKNGFVPVGSNIPREITETARNAVQSLEVRASKKN
ncbi:larval cuticle protein 1 [Drosophila innubila]|uniref:larval cuticle protein 1 n=1 Tax=Drosophila innubila TaxID=198719 RepID=UPI00148C997B|nr:larval cuticle protein 1 [Drosophila innubila]